MQFLIKVLDTLKLTNLHISNCLVKAKNKNSDFPKQCEDFASLNPPHFLLFVTVILTYLFSSTL